MKQEEVEAIFLLAGIDIVAIKKIPNGYWPDEPDYAERRSAEPWWKVHIKAGWILIGWRKRVISIDWENTPVREKITTDNVEQDRSYVHAYSYGRAVDYLRAFRHHYGAMAYKSN